MPAASRQAFRAKRAIIGASQHTTATTVLTLEHDGEPVDVVTVAPLAVLNLAYRGAALAIDPRTCAPPLEPYVGAGSAARLSLIHI